MEWINAIQTSLAAWMSPYPVWGIVLASGVLALFLGFFSAPLFLWLIAGAAVCLGLGAPVWTLWGWGGLFLLFGVAPIRRVLLSSAIMKVIQWLKIMPEISETEKVALEAGNSWMEAEVFGGKPDFKKLMAQSYVQVSGEEKEFIDNQCETLCAMASDWEIYENRGLPEKVWDYVKKEKFLGMIVPKEYGGLGFSPTANSAVVQKLCGHSIALGVNVMVPNSLGPAELLVHYGTKKQKDYYLPRLADGREIPCFALTEPGAGSDAGSLEASGVVFKDTDGELKIRLNFEKRYISLAAISTVMGLATKLYDPENLLGKGKSPGITCLLIPSNSDGVTLGKRHNPMGVPFHNCPIKGEDVIAGVDQIIGGPEMAGRGWMMLMESLSVGRAISLPALSVGGIKRVLRATSAYVNIRKQFGLEIGFFGGVQEPLANIAGHAYLVEAMRTYTTGAVLSGVKPAVTSAIAKLMGTEFTRTVSAWGMDIVGGAGISRGPRNNIANFYTGVPIAITVEGANILTRTMIVYGQGAIRCHPYAYAQVQAVNANDVKAFDKAFWGHIGFIVRNKCRAKLLFLTRGRIAGVSGKTAVARKYMRKISWASATFAILSDIAMGTYGGNLKMKEKITGRFADMLSWMYIATTVLKRFEAAGSPKDHLPFFHWSMQHCLAEYHKALIGLCKNYDVPGVMILFRVLSLFFRMNPVASHPSDDIAEQMCKAISTNMKLRDELTEGLYLGAKPEEALRRYDDTFAALREARPLLKKVKKAIRAKQLPKKRIAKVLEEAVEKNILTQVEKEKLEKAEAMRHDAIMVDSFDVEDFSLTLLDSDKVG